MLSKLLSKISVVCTFGIALLSSLPVEGQIARSQPLKKSFVRSNELSLEGKASYFISSSSRFRDIYGKTGLYRVEAQMRAWKNIYMWASLGYLYGSGDTNMGNHSHIHLVPLSIGLSYLFKMDKVSPYVGIGPTAAYSYIHNSSQHVTRNQDGWGGGFLAKLGLLANVTDTFFIDFFVDYSLLRMSVHHGKKVTTHKSGDFSGFSVGLGAGYKF